MDDNEQTPEILSPSRRALVLAAGICIFSFAVVYGLANPLMKQLQAGPTEWVAYSILPLCVTFVVLYRSDWHREITGLARTCSVLALSCSILVGDLIAAAVLLCVVVFFIVPAAFCLMTLLGDGGYHP